MTGVKFYLQAKLHGMRRYSSISVYGSEHYRPNYRLQKSRIWTTFFDTEKAAIEVKNKLEGRYPQVAFKVAKDKTYGNTGYGLN